jgi:PAS domain S-box-containing protein
VEQIPAVIFMAFLDQDLSEAYVSPHVETVLGFTQEEWLNDPVRWYNHIHPDDRTRWSIEAAQLILSGQPLRSVYRVIARNGHVVWFHCEVKIVLTEDGRPWFLHGAAFDITDLKQAETSLQEARDELEARVQERTSELAQANRNLQQEIAERKRAQAELARTVEELRQSNADLEQFAYSASHDLQEPLRTVSVYSQMLQRKLGSKLGASGDEYVGYILSGAKRMNQLLADLRIFIQSSAMAQDPAEEIDAGEALRSALVNLTAAIESSGVSITHGSLPRVRIHEFQLEQLFQNLIGNAIRYCSQEPPQIEVTAERSGEEWRFSVRDNGIGIDPQYKEQIFGMFKRLHSEANYPGTGMGLAICKRIVERAGGRIWVESQLGRGSTFLFTVPAANTTEA